MKQFLDLRVRPSLEKSAECIVCLALTLLLVIGYLCYLVSLGLTVVALIVLAITTSRQLPAALHLDFF